MSTETTAGPISCWNCRQELPVGSARCVYCGVPQNAASAALIVAPHGVATAVGPAAIPVRAPERRSPLGPAFAGRPAGVGTRLAAFTIDAAAALILAIAAALIGRSLVLGGVVLFEAVSIVGLVQARTGASLGNLLLRVRVSTLDAPYSPGVGRSFVRGIVVCLGGLVALVGAWVVVLSSAWDASGARRSWADRAARTVVVTVPRRRRTPRQAPVAPLDPSVAAGRPVLEAGPAPAGVWGVPATPSPPAPAAPTDRAPEPLPAERLDAPATPLAPPPGAVVAPSRPSRDGLLLAFDIGQRELLPHPVAVNLGRSPAPQDPTDWLVSVRDPESTVSKTHARLESTRSGTWITDLGSTNGTDLLDEEGHATPVQARVRTRVDDGTRVRLGNRVFTVSVLIGDES